MKRERWSDFNWLALKMHNDFFRQISDQLSGVVVDLGCGTQPYKDDISRLGCDYISVNWLKSYHKVRPDIIADLNVGVALPDCFANVVITFSVIEHLHRPSRLVEEAYRILKPNGMLYLQVPFQWAVHESPFDYFRFTKYGLDILLNNVGFKSISIKPNSGYWVTSCLKFNYHTMRFVRGPMIIRLILQAMLTPLWFLGQVIASLADKLDYDESETASYTVCAKKPAKQEI